MKVHATLRYFILSMSDRQLARATADLAKVHEATAVAIWNAVIDERLIRIRLNRKGR